MEEEVDLSEVGDRLIRGMIGRGRIRIVRKVSSSEKVVLVLSPSWQVPSRRSAAPRFPEFVAGFVKCIEGTNIQWPAKRGPKW